MQYKHTAPAQRLQHSSAKAELTGFGLKAAQPRQEVTCPKACQPQCHFSCKAFFSDCCIACNCTQHQYHNWDIVAVNFLSYKTAQEHHICILNCSQLPLVKQSIIHNYRDKQTSKERKDTKDTTCKNC